MPSSRESGRQVIQISDRLQFIIPYDHFGRTQTADIQSYKYKIYMVEVFITYKGKHVNLNYPISYSAVFKHVFLLPPCRSENPQNP